MASNNRLLGSGKVYTKSDVTQIPNNYAPHWMFHKEHPEGQIVRNQVTLDKLVAAGWVRHPGQCTLLPGHEALYEGDREVEKVKKTKSKEKTKTTKGKKRKAVLDKVCYICSKCAENNGGVWPDGHIATCHSGVCDICGEKKSLANVGDWNWSDGKHRGMRD